ncbi:MAG: response regulator transcription factor [Desulfobacter sp.]|nr:MAG: response regulator transcription factor [Desulfobacter sp.]
MLVFTGDKGFVERLQAILGERKIKAVADKAAMPYMAKGSEMMILDLETGFSPDAGFQGSAPAFSCPCLALSNVPEYEEAARLLRYGIRGYGNKYMQGENFRQALSVVASGQMWLIPSILNQFIQNMALPAGNTAGGEGSRFWDQVSKREKEVAGLVAKGLSNQEIAEAMYVSLRTVKAHLTNIFRKTGCRDRMELALKVNRLK